MDNEINGAEEKDSTTIFRMPSSDATVPDLMSRDRLEHPTLSIIKGPQTGVTFVLDKPEITIGRDPRNSVFLNDMTVSRHHAKIEFNGTHVTIEDLGSLNGTWVDGAIVNKAFLDDGSTVQVGTFRMVFHTTQGTERIATGQ
ncbi:MAG: FHA domain-containing protein [Atopobiaceae bacterium]|jgi:pSer/pThr/pTyr-binding forkhead associated (FHA) protein|nr:FHA domain-containing protein [Atopobiaceae bacterium]MCI2173220.1 FHA domain-containing protein [Atopobiaceae bacterium]MCI2207215.1 FHA domain-containing protein [Atopobiaceae bacterium]